MSQPTPPTVFRTPPRSVPFAAPVPPRAPQPAPEYQAPPGIAEQAAEQVEAPPEPDMVEQLRQESEPPEWPVGAPAFRAVHRTPWGVRVTAFRLFDAVVSKGRKMSRYAGQDLTGQLAEQFFDYLKDVSEFLRTVAVDPEDFTAWEESTGYDPEKLQNMFNAYAARLQPGEADSSSS